MIATKSKKPYEYKLFQRKSLLTHLKSKSYASTINKKFKKYSRFGHSIHHIQQIYRNIWLIVTILLRIFAFIDRLTRNLFLFVEQIVQIIRVVHGWIQMIRAIFSAVHLITTRIMLFASHIHRICYLLTILFEPLSNRSFERSVRAFSHFVFYYYSSNGACYTLKARTKHIASRVKARWGRKRPCRTLNENDDMDTFYDALSEEEAWF